MHTIKIGMEERVSFHNHACHCIGSGRMGLALHEEYQKQLRFVQEKMRFSYIRGHGLFSDDMAIYQEREENGRVVSCYNFTYLDRVMDSFLEKGLRPFLELGFMPQKLASGDQTVFYWKGNVTPPKEYEKWTLLVQATLSHLMARYGKEEVRTWPVEVWNEPNLSGFWKDADMEAYFRLYAETAAAVKSVDEGLRVGGPAICGVEEEKWMVSFLDFCRENKAPLDFVTRHHYSVGAPTRAGGYVYHSMAPFSTYFDTLKGTRRIVDSYPEYAGFEIHITEINTSYDPRCPVHDTNLNAAYMARAMAFLGDDNASYSYWTFGDVFEESGVPASLFHGGFGLVAAGSVPKPTFWTFAFYKQLTGDCVFRSGDAVVMWDGEKYRGLLWNPVEEAGEKVKPLSFSFEAKGEALFCLTTQRVDEECCNPLKIWHDLGEPANPSPETMRLLQGSAVPLTETKRTAAENGQIAVSFQLKRNAMIYFELSAVHQTSDYGYEYGRI